MHLELELQGKHYSQSSTSAISFNATVGKSVPCIFLGSEFQWSTYNQEKVQTGLKNCGNDVQVDPNGSDMGAKKALNTNTQ